MNPGDHDPLMECAIRLDEAGRSTGSTSARCWAPAIPKDTRPEFADQYNRWWLGLSGPERADWWLRRTRTFGAARYRRIRQADPDASEPEILARWTEETYRESVPAERLARLCELIRRDTPAP